MKKLSLVLLFVLIISSLSCTKDENPPSCQPTNVTMKINGETFTYQAIGRGISLKSWGYELQLNFYRGTNQPFTESGISLKLPFQATGKNIIQQFEYSQSVEQVYFIGDFTTGALESNVVMNTNNCFYATFSGNLNDGNQEIVITEGVISVEYEEPFGQ